MTPDQIQSQLNLLQSELDKLKQVKPDGMIGNSSDSPYIEPDYTHLLPEGYEFCEEGEHTGWVKIRLIGDEGENKLGYSFYGLDCANKPYYRPIRPIKYHVAVHEAVTVEPNPYQVDWANAPEWADSHAYDKNEIGVFYGVEQGDSQYKPKWTASGLLLPTGLDWKQSKTVRSK